MKRFLALLLVASPAWADHPLITEDTGVLGKGGRQLELHGERIREGGERATEVAGVLSYGVHEKADLQLALPYNKEWQNAEVALKWRFFERDKLALALKPEVVLPTNSGRVGWGTALAAGYELGRFELLGHLGYARNSDESERRSLWHASVAVLWAATEKLKLVLDLGRDSNRDPHDDSPVRELVYGLTYAASKDIDLGFGVKKGLSDAADDRALRAGIKLRW